MTNKNKKLLNAKANLNLRPNTEIITGTAKVYLSLKDTNIIQFNLDLKRHDYENFLQFEKIQGHQGYQ